MINSSRLIPAEPYFVFYGNTDSPDGALHHTGDDPTGGNSETVMTKQYKLTYQKLTALLTKSYLLLPFTMQSKENKIMDKSVIHI
jgi:stress response protein SCP2